MALRAISSNTLQGLVGLLDTEFLKQIDEFSENLESPKELLADEILICECNCISVADIRSQLSSPEELSEEILKSSLGLGSGCSSCLKSLSEWKNKVF